MNRDSKKNLKIIAPVNLSVVQTQIEEYWPEDYCVILLSEVEINKES